MSTARLPAILVVDDEPDICQNLADILEDFGYTVETALNGEEALEKLRSRTFDIALLDFRMPGMDGLTLCRKIREVQAGTVALIVTAYASPDMADQFQQAGAWKVLSKPVDLTQLISLVAQAASQPTVMVVDDDVEACQNLEELFRDHNYRVCLAHSVGDAVRRLDQRSYDVVLVDLKLSPGDGGQVLAAIRERDPLTPVILITGHQWEWERRLQSPTTPDVDAVCYKPFDLALLLKTIHQLVYRSQQ